MFEKTKFSRKKKMQNFPKLQTQRLKLRELQKDDAKAIAQLANDKNVSRYLSSMPYPYTIEDAKEFMQSSKSDYTKGEKIDFKIIEKSSDKFIGMVGLDISVRHNHGTIGYWLGKEYWSNGYIPEAAATVLEFGFEVLKLHRISSHHLHPNPASGKVLQKIGLKYEGRRCEHFKKDEEYFDILDYGILRRDYQLII